MPLAKNRGHFKGNGKLVCSTLVGVNFFEEMIVGISNMHFTGPEANYCREGTICSCAYASPECIPKKYPARKIVLRFGVFCFSN